MFHHTNGLNSHGNTQKFCRVVNSFSYGNFVGHQSSLKGAALIEGDAGSLFFCFFFSSPSSCCGKGKRGARCLCFLCSNGLLHIFIMRESLKGERQHKIPEITRLLLPVDARLRGFVYIRRLLILGKYTFTLYHMNILWKRCRYFMSLVV